MKYILLLLILLFYIFFFTRAYLLSKKLGKKIKSNGILVNSSIFSAGLSSIIFIVFLFLPEDINKYSYILFSHKILIITGALFIAIGLIFSTLASLSLKNSWRIGVSEKEKTDLIIDGMYRFSRNPYFLSYDLVLIGMVFCYPAPVLIVPVFITMVLFHLMILKEEKHLEINHAGYKKYKNEVRRYL